jgi:opacity protein-like surface antigen
MMKMLSTLAAVLCVAASAINANAGTVSLNSSKEIKLTDFPYEKGDWEVQGLAGAFWDLGIYSGQPKFDYALESIRLGYMVTGIVGNGCLRGNFEVLVEAMGGEFWKGPANYLVGGNLLFRWNFVQGPNAKLVPYVQIGGGGLYHDANTDSSVQKILGGNVEAMLTGGLGLRYHLNENWALDVEASYRHISDAGTTAHNLGLNSIGAQVGLSYFFH